MPRKHLIRSNVLPYHVTARTNNRELFPIPLERMWKVLESECQTLSLVYGVEFHAVVLMPNHIHMIFTVPEHDLGIIMNRFMLESARELNKQTGRSGHVYGGPYFWSLIGSSRYFCHAMKYVYRNPVKAKLCMNVEDYPYSTLYGLLGLAPLPVPVHFTRVAMELSLPSTEPSGQLEWLNRPFPNEMEEIIRKGLRSKTFDRILDRKNRRHYPELEQLL